ncbi:MAG: radical SAM protein [Candidatus Omnitrophota bacterium]|nr:radical SAM protein [Candidatus Omnitrophota bacterium]
MKVLFFHRNAEWIGIEYLSSILKKAGHETELIFDPGAGDVEYKFRFIEKIFDVTEKMIKMAKAYKPDLIAFSCLTNLYPWVNKMSRLIKEVMDVPIIVGGLHPTLLPEYVIKNPYIDMICIGEGEEALLELVESMQSGCINYSTKNIWFKRNGEVIRNPVRPLIQNLDSLPFPDKSLFRKYGCFSERIYVMTTRGCPYQCSYCYNSYYKKLLNFPGFSYLRRRSVRNVIDELKFFKSQYPIREVFFCDDIFTIDDKWIKNFCIIYKKEINLPFKAFVHPKTVKREIMKLLKDAGCIYVDIGIESGSEEVRRKILKRHMSNQDIINAAKILKEVGIKFCTLNMVGLPTETAQQMRETYELNKIIKPDGAIVSIFYPYPKTELADFCLENKLIAPEEYEKICNGEGGGYKDSCIIIKNTDLKEAKRQLILIPFLTRTPAFLHPIIKALPINNFTRILSIPFLSIPRNNYIRTKESLTMFMKSNFLYFFSKKFPFNISDKEQSCATK